MPLPKVAIVGRPNVGKSSVFNWLAGRTIAIVEPTAGVTRDRLSTIVEARDRFFELIDTGGMGIKDVDDLTKEVERQIDVALREADLVLFVVDSRDGLVPLDEHVSARLRTVTKPVLVVANKTESDRLATAALEFHRLGWPDLLTVSAKENKHKPELLDWIEEHLPPASRDAAPPPETDLKIAIVGRRNVGKSTFINALAQEERVIVSEVPGTTRDSVDVRFERDGKAFIAIDTAGVRKRASIANSIEFYSIARAERSIRRADVVLLFFDPRAKISKVDKQLADYVLENHKPAIFVVNKWDLAKPTTERAAWVEYLRKTFPTLDYVPIAFITAKTGKNVHAVLNLAQHLHKQAGARVATAKLNKVLAEATDRHAPPVRMNRSPRIFFGTQVATHPPTIVLFTNGPELFDDHYQRYLLKSFRDTLPFPEVPIKLYFRMKGSGDVPEDKAPIRPSRRKERQVTARVNRQAARPLQPKKKQKVVKPDVWRDV